jgi:hypothetical protein
MKRTFSAPEVTDRHKKLSMRTFSELIVNKSVNVLQGAAWDMMDEHCNAKHPNNSQMP